ncbi:hypothetical protein C1H46_015731 [Malus baccata]|uniref:GB1/RHD3-type G domain-containing protein n=1 Tax=Malus baccata TaxID=106549 RepID=A0A540MIU6_MALBA|nr:hypothetical protein C1H46_015731 [Malus baccata]
MDEDCCATQLIYGDGEFNADGLDRFVKEVKLTECGLSYAVVAIMGQQSSGKSTLLNHLFGTKFREMDAYSGRSKTTRSDSSPSSLTLAQIGRIFEWNCSPWPAATPRPSCLGRLRWTHHKRERKRDGFFHSIFPGGLAGDRRGVVPASGFSFSAQQIWKVIKENKDLDLPAHKFVYPAYSAMLGHLRYNALEDFQVRLEQSMNKGEGFSSSVRTCAQSSMLEFEKGCADAAIQQANWDASKVWEKLRRDIDAHASSVCSAKLAELNSNYEKKLSSSLSGPVEALLETGAKDTWASIRRLLNRETEVAVSEFSTAVANFELDNETVAKMKQHLKDYSLKLLSTMAAIRLDEKPDNIENVLVSSLVDRTVTVSSSQNKNRELGPSTDPLASTSWEEVSSKDTLITTVQCKSLWRQFKAETEYSVTQAILAQEAHKRSNNWLPPPWAIMAMIVLGFNEFMMLLKNPLYLMVLFVAFLLSKALWVQMDITGQFQHGAVKEAQGNQTPEAQRRPVSISSQSYRNETPQPNPVTSSFPESSVSSNISSSDTGMEYSSPHLRQRRTANVEEVESS